MIELVEEQEEGVACGNEALTLLDNTDTRKIIVNELLEVCVTMWPIKSAVYVYIKHLRLCIFSVTFLSFCVLYMLCWFQLEAFLSGRLQEISASAGDVLSSCQFESAPAAILVDEGAVESMLREVAAMLDGLNSARMQELILIRSSPR